MKKRIIATILGISMLIPATIAYAYSHGSSDTIYMQSTNTQITGTLYLLYDGNPNIGQANTHNDSGNGVTVKTKIYATAGGQTISGSSRVVTGNPNAYVKSTARLPDAWGSGHTTHNTADPWDWLYIQVSDLR